ncbi:hypothetical protein Y032_0563g3510 [Ancylostoma ceylanicum]|uniref:Uncharacterized protein n=1 Tax=Ancylostoma ceylanicum TaxID=53326 RepID=A0A016WQQ7_9BILA|nr:hypothetical protein Y032_0563g3510 [Ancylostoma ceylanicum]
MLNHFAPRHEDPRELDQLQQHPSRSSGLKLHKLGSFVFSNRAAFSSTTAVNEIITLHDVNMPSPSVQSLYRCIIGLSVKLLTVRIEVDIASTEILNVEKSYGGPFRNQRPASATLSVCR